MPTTTTTTGNNPIRDEQNRETTTRVANDRGTPVRNTRQVTNLPGGYSYLRVYVRLKPFDGRKSDDKDNITVQSSVQIVLSLPRDESKTYRFDRIFSQSSSNHIVYEHTLGYALKSLHNWTDTAYVCFGQTGAGKTYTLFGQSGIDGVVYHAIVDLFDSGVRDIEASLFEVYNNQIHDLLNKTQRLQMFEDQTGNLVLSEVTVRTCKNTDDLLRVVREGLQDRATGETAFNYVSSRSHAILRLNARDRHGKQYRIDFVDMAGTEKAADRCRAMPTGDDFSETAEINRSLLAVKECITSLMENRSHTPYRQCKLTMLLRDALAGNVRAVFLANVIGSCRNYSYTKDSLKHACSLRDISSWRNPVPDKQARPASAAFYMNLEDGTIRDITRRRHTSIVDGPHQCSRNDQRESPFHKKHFHHPPCIHTDQVDDNKQVQIAQSINSSQNKHDHCNPSDNRSEPTSTGGGQPPACFSSSWGGHTESADNNADFIEIAYLNNSAQNGDIKVHNFKESRKQASNVARKPSHGFLSAHYGSTGTVNDNDTSIPVTQPDISSQNRRCRCNHSDRCCQQAPSIAMHHLSPRFTNSLCHHHLDTADKIRSFSEVSQRNNGIPHGVSNCQNDDGRCGNQSCEKLCLAYDNRSPETSELNFNTRNGVCCHNNAHLCRKHKSFNISTNEIPQPGNINPKVSRGKIKKRVRDVGIQAVLIR